jgi:DMSO/TMAO reductase YedYZ molybdopterin-dependent catalytic subunit
MTSRRRFLRGAGSIGALSALGPAAQALAAQVGGMSELGFAELPDGTLAEQQLYALPGKVPLIKKTFRPPNFETPIQYFRAPITQNRAFFVRWHLAAIPEVDANTWTLAVGGDAAEREVKLTLTELKKAFKPVEVTAVNQCSGNRRGLFEPHVAGVEWGAGAMGNAVWRGVRLKDLLARTGVRGNAVELVADGADRGAIDKTPDFVKSLPMDIAMRDETLVAFEMNGEPLPHWNGFPARLVVPGWTGTYWVKQLVSLRVVSEPEKNFWMSTAYRLPRGLFKTPTFSSQLYAANEPITAMVVNSLVTSLKSGQQIALGRPLEVRGLAWDGGSGIAKVEVSLDGGERWFPAKLGKDLGRYSFREFAFSTPTKERGSRVVMARSTSVSGETQADKLIFNPAGYHHNVPQRIYVEIV